MHVVDLEPGDPRLESEVLPVLLQLREHLTARSFDAIYREGHPQGLRFTAVYDGDRCVAVAGWRLIATTFADGRKLYVDDLVTSSTERSQGFGKALLAELVRRAEDAGARVFDLDSGVHRPDAHRFYFREGMQISGFHFHRTLVERTDV
jgi:GNAT superfamily N-acetyltransferase